MILLMVSDEVKKFCDARTGAFINLDTKNTPLLVLIQITKKAHEMKGFNYLQFSASLLANTNSTHKVHICPPD
jgi:hypothetical protein